MPKINFITSGGDEFSVDANIGSTVMDAASQNAVPGIDAECGGACACATCHVYAPEGVALPAADAMESDMLDFAWEPNANSRLSCQIKITEDMDGMSFTIPDQQA